MPILVGVAGWSYPDWEGPVYPRSKGRGFHPLAFLAPSIDVMEVNASFYAVPARTHVARWATIAKAHPHLTFTAKLHRDLTHVAWDPARREVLDALTSAFQPLEEEGRFEAWLAQFPLGFVEGAGGRRHLSALAGALTPRPWVLEVRHRSWFTPSALAFLRGLGCSVARLDMPAAAEHLPDDAPAVGRLGYLRLHGQNAQAWFDPKAGRDRRYDHRYTPAEVDGLVARARATAATSERTLVVANNHYGGKAVAVALELKARLGGAPVPAPDTLLDAFPDLARFAVRTGQGRLFS
jgi:uncharacterized protein YecE (DUF72 family)